MSFIDTAWKLAEALVATSSVMLTLSILLASAYLLVIVIRAVVVTEFGSQL
jgi:hypothetical protein